MIKQFVRKRIKISWGFFNSHIRKIRKNYKDIEWWDNKFYTEGVSDRKTISSQKSLFSALYHYNSVEMIILNYFFDKKVSLEGSCFLDIGSGSGHWIDFYRSLGSSKAVGVDVSRSSVNFLKEKYMGSSDVKIYNGRISEISEQLDERFNIVNAIGVMFHIVDDNDWEKTIKSVANLLKDGGLFIVGGHFGLLDKLNVQVDKNGQVNKRLRSKGNWKKTLNKAGFSKISFYSNNAYLRINDPLPENNIMVAEK